MSVINISKKAFPILKNIYIQNNKKYISFSIKSGGCSGFEYNLKPCNLEPSKLDEIAEYKDLKIKIDGDSLLHLLGTEIDWEDNIMGQRFIFKNPNAEFSCGCGKSFS
jgi:iron-sulfur cluster assembly accessory protein